MDRAEPSTQRSPIRADRLTRVTWAVVERKGLALSEPERPSEEETEFISKEAPPQTVEISEAARAGSVLPAPEPEDTAAFSPPPADTPPTQPSAAPQAASLPLPPAPPPMGMPYSEPEPQKPPTTAFVPPELLARRRAAAPPSQPYQPIAGWSLAPAAPMEPQQTVVAGSPTQGAPMGGQPAGPANGFAVPPTGGFARSAPAPTQGAPAPIAPRVERSAESGPSRRAFMLTFGAVLAVAGIVIAVITMNGGGADNAAPTVTASPTVKAAAPVALKFNVESHDPVGGTGFREKGGGLWDTATYKRPLFGNLKKGIGLVLDLGSAQTVKTVSFDTKTGPFNVELHALDEKPVGYSIGDLVGESVSANGVTKLDGSKGGKHQYWMIWVTSTNSTFKVEISDIKADQ